MTFNLIGWSYVSWLVADWPGDNMPLKALAGVVLLILYAIFLLSTWRAIGVLGLFWWCCSSPRRSGPGLYGPARPAPDDPR